MHPPSSLFGGIRPLYRPGSIRDTNRITYRCFLPDLTRFMTVCCAVSDRNGPNYPNLRPSGGNSAPHKADFGKRAPLAPHLAQPETKYAIFAFLQEKFGRYEGLGLRPSGFPTSLCELRLDKSTPHAGFRVVRLGFRFQPALASGSQPMPRRATPSFDIQDSIFCGSLFQPRVVS